MARRKANKYKDLRQWEEKFKDKEKLNPVNKAIVRGLITERVTFHHEISGQRFYKTTICIKRLSGIADDIPVILPRSVLANRDIVNKSVEIVGRLSSYTIVEEDGKKQLVRFILAKDMRFLDKAEDFLMKDENVVYLEGYIHRRPFYRKTPLGRELADLYLKVCTYKTKLEYLSAIVWGQDAKEVSKWKFGDKVQLYGRIQSRLQGNEKTEIEVSVFYIEKVL